MKEKSQLTRLKEAKLAGLKARDAYEAMVKGIREAYADAPDQRAGMAMSLAQAAEDVRKVYGKKATRFLFEEWDAYQAEKRGTPK